MKTVYFLGAGASAGSDFKLPEGLQAELPLKRVWALALEDEGE